MHPLSSARATRAVLSLVLSSLACLLMLAVRSTFLEVHGFGFIPKNLLLAWIPMISALAVHGLYLRGRRWRWLLALCAMIWFLFFPNAPYLITDFIHVNWHLLPKTVWFDLLLMACLAWTGLFLGYFSLYLMQDIIEAWRGRAAGFSFAAAMLALGTLGVYAGRFWRWNSKDALLRPVDLAGSALLHLKLHTAQDAAMFFVTFFGFSLLTYGIFFNFAHLRADLPRLPVRTPASAPEENEVAAGTRMR